MKPFYKIVVNENDDTGVDFNSFVDIPAHLKGFIAFGKEHERYALNEEKRMVTGVFISVGTPIYRNSKDLGEHYIIFDAPTVEVIRKKFFKQKYNLNVNTMHDMGKIVKGAVLIDSYIVSSSDPKFPDVPEAFKSQKLQDGSWLGTYYIEDDELWNDVKSGKFNGFSVEGWFEKKEVKVKNVKMSKQKKTIWSMLFSSETPDNETPESFALAMTAEGVVVSYEGELGEGTALTIEVDGTVVPAPEGEHQLTLEDGSVKIVVLNAEGVVESIADFEMNAADDVREEVAEVMRKLAKDTDERFKAIETENAKLKAELEAIKEGDKFKANPKKSTADTGKMSISDLMKNKKQNEN